MQVNHEVVVGEAEAKAANSRKAGAKAQAETEVVIKLTASTPLI